MCKPIICTMKSVSFFSNQHGWDLLVRQVTILSILVGNISTLTQCLALLAPKLHRSGKMLWLAPDLDCNPSNMPHGWLIFLEKKWDGLTIMLYLHYGCSCDLFCTSIGALVFFLIIELAFCKFIVFSSRSFTMSFMLWANLNKIIDVNAKKRKTLLPLKEVHCFCTWNFDLSIIANGLLHENSNQLS